MATKDSFQPETKDFAINHDGSWLSTSSDTFKTPTEEPHGSKRAKKKIKLALINCLKCNDLIKEKHLYAIGESYWHKCCVKCDNCKIQVDDCGFLVENTLLCRTCYNQSIHVTKCFGCKLPMRTQEVVMYALNQPYHLSCFKCNFCQNTLSKGDKFVFHSGFLICKQDFDNGTYLNSLPTSQTKQQSCKVDTPTETNGIRRKTKISNPQRQYLESYYMRNSNPSIKQRAYIAEELNLPVKVIQTWFCNYRTKMKMQRNHELDVLNEKLQGNDHDRCNLSKVKRMLLQQDCLTPEPEEYAPSLVSSDTAALDCPTNCQISQSTEDHSSPQDLSSDLSGMYTCPDISKSYSHHTSAGSHSHSNSDDNNQGESIDDSGGLTYADLSNSCVKSIDRSIMAGFSANFKEMSSAVIDRSGLQPKVCLTWS